METKIFTVDKNVPLLESYPQIKEAAKLIIDNEVIAFPTETVYGLGANAQSDEAVKKIYEAKGRPSDNPLIVHIASFEQVDYIVQSVPDYAKVLMETFWPGPLTLILPKKGQLSKYVTAGLNTIAVRMPNHPLALALIKEANVPVAAPSANLSGKPSPTKAQHVYNDLKDKIAGIVNGGATGVGLESTVLDCTTDIPTILRPGGITKEQLEDVIGKVTMDVMVETDDQAPKSPGMKYTHYAPDAPLTIVNGGRDFLQSLADQYKNEGKRVGILTTKENAHFYNVDKIIVCGERRELQTVANELYDVLRQFDDEQIDVILSESFPNEGIGQAIMNRLLKASGHHVVSE
ncbi:L-threonylcarbamoyladenylate synthase [Metabacillus fastidiosus]|uniref:L-threonylcarbamoyladenylate synthase n=1 Tax=Metabacillus fastidiosus TaxID=1458 RepID=UPI002E1DDD4E|nr:L-threonylcarbamoyladenylate synthase [Metabacillus fastidiosus]MED4534499.1 L-threonylcarbamoyladenylate synthase [Metabacillus fastidiosus]